MSELHAYLKLPEARQGRPLILISNSLDTRTLQQISKVCLTFEIQPVKPERLQNWLKTEIPATYSGDLRSLRRQIAGLEIPQDTVEIPEGIMPIACWTLWGEWDPHLNFDIENNEGNLASLICLENIPERIEASLGATEEAWRIYLSLFNAYKVSDQGDFCLSEGCELSDIKINERLITKIKMNYFEANDMFAKIKNEIEKNIKN